MATSINERFLDFQVAQQIRWIRLQNREVREALKILSRVDAQLKSAIENASIDQGQYTAARLNALKLQVTELMSAIHGQLAPILMSSVQNAAILSAEIEEAMLTRILPAGLDVTTPNLGVLQMAPNLRPFNGAVMADWVEMLRVADLSRTWRAILDGITSGTTTEDLIRELNGSRTLRYKDGVREVSRRGLEALVRTSINHATNQGRQMVWEANQDIIASVRWVATLDSRTTPICQFRDGRVGPVSQDGPWTPPPGADVLDPPMARPPAHPNCRSTTVAVTKSWRELGFDMDEMDPGTRASMDGQVPANLTYYDWLGRQSAAVQKDVLGPTRYDMWKNGGVTPDRFVNDKGKMLTLNELRRQSVVSASPEMTSKLAINEYSNRMYSYVNTKLRSGVDLVEAFDPDLESQIFVDPAYTRSIIKKLDSLMKERKLSTLYRYADKDWVGVALSELKPGYTFTDKAFVSTATDLKRAEAFNVAGAYRFEITSSGNVKSIDVSEFSTFEEAEVLLNRGLVFRVLNVDHARKVIKIKATARP